MSRTEGPIRGSQDVVEEPQAEEQEQPRGIPPILFPLVAMLFIIVMVWSLSRILLAVSDVIAPVIALLVALNILIGAALVAYGRRVRRRPATFPLLMVAGVAVVAAGAVATRVGAPAEEGGGGTGGAVAVAIAAQNIKFDKDKLSFPAGQNVTIRFNNQDAGIEHNVAIYSGKDATGESVFQGEIITGPATANYRFEAPSEGSYYFQCDVHPQMNGTATVTAAGGGDGGGGDGGGGDGGGGDELVAANIAFQPNQLTLQGGAAQATIRFNNQDSGVPHNVAIFEGTGPTGALVFRGDVVTGPATTSYTFSTPPKGRYYFHCDVHPQMKGTLTVT